MNEKKCVQCAKPIPEEATKCFVCGAHQRWFNRQLSFSSLILSLLISLLAVAGILMPQIKEIFFPKNTKIIIKQSDIDNSTANLKLTKAIYPFAGEEISDELKKVFIPDYPDRDYSIYDNELDYVKIYYQPDRCKIENNFEYTNYSISHDSLYYYIHKEMIIALKFKFILRNVGEKYGVLHYLKTDESLMKEFEKFMIDSDFPKPYVKISNSLFDKVFSNDSLKNMKISTEYLDALEFEVKDTIHEFSIYKEKDQAFIMDFLDTTIHLPILRTNLTSLVYNHNDSETKNKHQFDLNATLKIVKNSFVVYEEDKSFNTLNFGKK